MAQRGRRVARGAGIGGGTGALTGAAVGSMITCAMPAAASAQALCRAGQVAVGEHCCWPGQTWDAGANACAGEPQCPDGFERSYQECRRLPPRAAAHDAAPGRPRVVYDAEGHAEGGGSGSAAGGGSTLFMGGAVLAGGGYVVGLGAGIAGMAVGGTSGPYLAQSVVPIGGPLLSAYGCSQSPACGAHEAMWVYGGVIAAAQLAGVVMLFASIPARNGSAPAPEYAVLPWVGERAGGLVLAGVF